MTVATTKNNIDFSNLCTGHLGVTFLSVFAVLVDSFQNGFSFGGFFVFIFIFFSLRIYYFSLKKLQYTYWTLTLLFLLMNTYMMLTTSSMNSLLFGLVVVAKCIEGYFTFSPIYYPMFNWWEYDFRHRNDLTATVSFNNQIYEARITDIRRNSACVKCFEVLPVGAKIVIQGQKGLENSISIEAKIITLQETSLGRGFSYGVNFLWTNELTKEYYSQMKKNWNRGKVIPTDPSENLDEKPLQ